MQDKPTKEEAVVTTEKKKGSGSEEVRNLALDFQLTYPELSLPQHPEISIPVSLYDNITDLGLTVPWGSSNLS